MKIDKPLVTVVCTVFNHEQYLKEAIASVCNQTYPNIQLIVIDNASQDRSTALIQQMISDLPDSTFIQNAFNKGLCAAFNQGLKIAKGKYIIDLSADDILHPSRIERQVEAFENLSDDYGVLFSNAVYIDKSGQRLDYHFNIDSQGHSLVQIPSGDVYKYVLQQYFICTPTMMMRKRVLDEMGGYDETLVFEDFDLWVRSSSRYKYHYQDEVLTSKRVLKNSLASLITKKKNKLLESSYIVCNKAYDLNRTQEEFDILAARIKTFIRKCFYAQEFELALKFSKLLNYIENPDLLTSFIIFLSRMHVPVNGIYRLYIHLFQPTQHRKEWNFLKTLLF